MSDLSAPSSGVPVAATPSAAATPGVAPTSTFSAGDPYSPTGSAAAGAGSGASGFNVVPANLASVAGTFAAQANALGEAIDAFSSQIGALGACWGNDTEGQKFGTSYLPGADQMLADLTDLQKGLDAIADALNASSSSYTDADAASTPTASTPTASTPT